MISNQKHGYFTSTKPRASNVGVMEITEEGLKSTTSLEELVRQLLTAPASADIVTKEFATTGKNIKVFSLKPSGSCEKSDTSLLKKIGSFLKKTLKNWLVKKTKK